MGMAEEISDSREFLKYVKIDLFPGERDSRKVVSSPPASPPIVDFAYEIHTTQVGHNCVGARINGRLMPLKTEPKSGISSRKS